MTAIAKLDLALKLLDEVDATPIGQINTKLDRITDAVSAARHELTPGGPAYVIWSNEHRAWWRPNECGYCTMLAGAGRYTREDALAICIRARGGRRFNDNPSEIPVLFDDAAIFWPDDKPEWREERAASKTGGPEHG